MELELKDISVEISNKKILNNVDLKIEDGSFVSLLGASGCGKSTILKTIAGIITQNKGSILLGGNTLNKTPPHKRKTVIVFQDFRLFPHMTLLENIGFPLKMSGLSKAEWKKKSINLLKKVNLEGFENRYSSEISGGQAQRVALARALASEPEVLLLDEPFSSLDTNLRKDMRKMVLELQRELKITTILVTHDHDEALIMSDKIAFMHSGKIVQYDTPENIFKNPINTTVADYFSKGIYIDGEIDDNKFISDLFFINIKKDSGKYKCLIRPQAVKIIKSTSGEFELVKKIYMGDYYLLTLYSPLKNFKLESIVLDSVKISEGDSVDIDIDKEKLIFIPL